jgi:hypothetical protein
VRLVAFDSVQCIAHSSPIDNAVEQDKCEGISCCANHLIMINSACTMLTLIPLVLARGDRTTN